MNTPAMHVREMSKFGRIAVLVMAFLGWGFAGVHMSIVSIVMRVASEDLLQGRFEQDGIATASSGDDVSQKRLASYDKDESGSLEQGERAKAREAVLGQWFGWSVCAFLFGAAAGGYLFGVIGDRLGRAKAMAASIACYSIFSGATYFSSSPEMLLVLRFLTCMGIGGMWPNGIALIAEAWPNVSRPILAGVLGTSANVGILAFAYATTQRYVTADDWRWTMLVGASPIFLAILSWIIVPESPKWLAIHSGDGSDKPADAKVGLGEVFRPPILKMTVIGILLGTVPLFGGWGVSNWAIAWASEVGDRKKAEQPVEPAGANELTKGKENVEVEKKPNPALKSEGAIARSLMGSITSLLGGALAAFIGRKISYTLLCVGALTCTQFLFRIDDPSNEAVFVLGLSEFKFWMGALGFFSGFFFGWLPLFLPELFPTRVRATGSGVSFNWGRILSGIGVLVTAAVLRDHFQGRYADVGLITGFIYAFGIVVILFAPNTANTDLDN